MRFECCSEIEHRNVRRNRRKGDTRISVHARIRRVVLRTAREITFEAQKTKLKYSRGENNL